MAQPRGTKVGVLLRDLDVTMYWSGRARRANTRSTRCSATCRRRLWALNEKRLVELTGPQDLHARFTGVPTSPPELVAWVDGLREAIGGA